MKSVRNKVYGEYKTAKWLRLFEQCSRDDGECLYIKLRNVVLSRVWDNVVDPIKLTMGVYGDV